MKYRKTILLLLGFVLAGLTRVRADATLLLEEPFSTFGMLNPTGHAAIYLSRVCAETPTQLRRCRPGETGAVISRYHKIGGYDWIAIPLAPYLYAVEQAGDAPAFADAAEVASLRDSYRRRHLEAVAPDAAEGVTPNGEWVQLVGSAYDRQIYGFEIETTEEQDDHLIEELNSRSNRSHFNLLFHNCADFSRTVMNLYYPHALKRSLVADAGISTPKQMAKSLVRYSKRHADLRFSAFIIPQVPGSRPTSKPVKGVAESLLKSKKYAIPLLVLHPWITGGVAVAYFFNGRFNPDHQTHVRYEARQLEQPIETIPAGTHASSEGTDAGYEHGSHQIPAPALGGGFETR